MEIDELTDRVVAELKQAGRIMQRDGKPVQDAGEARAILRGSLQEMAAERLATLERLGVVS